MARFQAGILLALLAANLGAQDKNQPASASATKTRQAKLSLPDLGAISDGLYHNPTFGFSYKLPFGWVDRTREMQPDSADASKSLLLLAIFERPPEATGDTVNSAVVIAAEPLSVYPAVKSAADYFGPLTEVATSKGFQVVNEPHDLSVGPMRLVRGDFSKARGTLTMHQTSLARLERGYAISFTFIGGSEDEVDELIEKLSFAARKPVR
jgi:hypothetical protein